MSNYYERIGIQHLEGAVHGSEVPAEGGRVEPFPLPGVDLHESTSVDLHKSTSVDLAKYKSIPVDLAFQKLTPVDFVKHESTPVDLAKHKSTPVDFAEHKSPPVDVARKKLDLSVIRCFFACVGLENDETLANVAVSRNNTGKETESSKRARAS